MCQPSKVFFPSFHSQTIRLLKQNSQRTVLFPSSAIGIKVLTEILQTTEMLSCTWENTGIRHYFSQTRKSRKTEYYE